MCFKCRYNSKYFCLNKTYFWGQSFECEFFCVFILLRLMGPYGDHPSTTSHAFYLPVAHLKRLCLFKAQISMKTSLHKTHSTELLRNRTQLVLLSSITSLKPQYSSSPVGPSYPGALAGFVVVVDLVLCPFVQFGPQSFDLPGGDCSLQWAVEVAVVQRIQFQLPAQDAEGLQSPFTGGCLDKVLKEDAGLCHTFILCLTHLLWRWTLSTFSYCFPAFFPSSLLQNRQYWTSMILFVPPCLVNSERNK